MNAHIPTAQSRKFTAASRPRCEAKYRTSSGLTGADREHFWGSMMAACLIVSVPIAIIYNFFVARFVTDITRDAIK
jgi:ABC-type glycerol-3-phosphate transport system permease component